MAGVRSTGGAIELTDHVPAARRAGGRPAQGGGRDRVRQDERAALVRRPPDLQRDLRDDEQPVGRQARARWIVGRAGGCRRRRVHLVRARHRHRRLGAHPVALLRRVRPEAELRRGVPTRVPRSRRRRHDRRRHQRVRADRPKRRGPRPAHRRARRPERGRCARVEPRPAGAAADGVSDYRVGVWFDEPACRSTASSWRSSAAPPTGWRTRERRSRTRIRRWSSSEQHDTVHRPDLERGLRERGSRGRRGDRRRAPRVVGRGAGPRPAPDDLGRVVPATTTHCSARCCRCRRSRTTRPATSSPARSRSTARSTLPDRT